MRKLFPRVVMMVADSARRSRSAVVSFSSPPKTLLGHSPKARFVVMTTERRWPVEGHEADLVEDEDVDTFEAPLVPAQFPGVPGFE